MHPFELPDQRAVSVELLPPLTPPPAPSVEVQLRPRQAAEPPVARPAPQAQPQAQTQPQAPPKPAEAQPAPPPNPPVEVRPSQPAAGKPVEVERRAAQAPRLQSQLAAPQIPEAPPEPVEVTRPAPALQPQVEVPRVRAPGQPRPLETRRAAPTLPQAAAAEAQAPAAAPSQVQVLTNRNVIQAPVEIRPRERAAPPLSATSQPGAAGIPIPGGAPAGGGPAAAQTGGQTGVQGRPGRPTVEDFRGVNGVNGGFAAKGLRQTLGCEDPDTYKLTPEERAACLERFAQRARAAPDLGLPISAKNQARYDSYVTCQRAYKGPAIPAPGETFEGSSITGVAPLPKECLPLENR